MEKMFRLPEKKDFAPGGQFYKVKLTSKDLPPEILQFVLPDYTEMLFKQKPFPNKKTLEMIRNICISTKKTAEKEERLLKSRQKKEIETKQLEDKIRDYFDNYYKNLYKSCKCIKSQTV